ncbi:MAG: hypothetical protein ACOCP2_03190 [Halohasta sp.]
MATEGELLEAFPDGPVTSAALSSLEDSDEILTAIPLVATEQGPNELSELVVIQTESVAVVAAYDDAGWTVEHRVDGSDRDPSAVLEDAMIAGQGDSSLVESPEE